MVEQDEGRIDPRSATMARTVTGLLALVATTAFVAGVPGLAWAGELAGLGHLRWAVPLVVDLAMVVLGLGVVVARARREPTSWMTVAVWGLMGLSAAIQAAHALAATAAASTVQLVVALVVGALPPIALVVASHAWMDLAVARKAARRTRTSAVTEAAPKPAATKRTTHAPSRVVGDRAEQRQQVLAMRASGVPFGRIAAEVGVPSSTAKRWAKEAA